MLLVQPGCDCGNATWRHPIGQLAQQFVQRTASWTKAKNDFETIFSAENTFGLFLCFGFWNYNRARLLTFQEK